MDQLARPLALITHSWGPRLERGQPTEPEPAEHQADGGDRLPQLARDLRPAQALPAQALDRVGDLARQPARRAGGRRAAIDEGRLAARPPPCQPLAHRPLADAELDGDAACRLLLVKHAAHHQELTVWRRAGILVDVHPGLRLAG